MRHLRIVIVAALVAWLPSAARAEVPCPGVDVGVATAELLAASEDTGFVLIAYERLYESIGLAVIRRMSVGVNGEGDGVSGDPSVSIDGAVTVFESRARNFFESITANRPHVFARDFCGPTRLLDQSAMGDEGDASAFEPFVSADGLAIVFRSFANNLIEGEDPFGARLYVEDMGFLERLGVAAANETVNVLEPVLSGDGRYVAFRSSTTFAGDDVPSTQDIYVWDRVTEAIELASRDADDNQATTPSDGASDAALSGDGRVAAFLSEAGLVPEHFGGDDQAYVRDLVAGTTTLASIGFDGEPADAPADAVEIAGNGCCVVFRSSASNLVEGVDPNVTAVFLRDLDAGTTEQVNVGFTTPPAEWFARLGAISDDGRYVAFDSPSPLAGNSNVGAQIYVRDRVAGETRLVSRNVLGARGMDGASGGGESSVAISGDGGWVAFTSTAENLVGGDMNDVADIFLAPNPFTEPVPNPDVTGFEDRLP